MRPNAHVTRLLDALGAGEELSARQAAEVAFVSRQHARRLIAKLLQRREIHIDRWDRHAWGPYFAVYAIGDDKNAPRPKAASVAERSRRHRSVNRIPRPDHLTKAMRKLGEPK